MLAFIFRWVFQEFVNGQFIKLGGLLKHKEDIRDFKYADLFGGSVFAYKPKQERLELKTVSIKDQMPHNTCVFNSYVVTREVKEGIPLSVRSVVGYAKAKGLLRGNGYSSLREGQSVGVNFGIAEESVMPEVNYDWWTYSSPLINGKVEQNAGKHRAKSYFSVKTQSEYLKALDEGNAVHTGFDWYSRYNMNEGLTAPWVLPWRKGVKVGGHAVAVIGYDMKKEVLIFQNSFGKDWGDGGKFYVNFSDFFRENPIGYVAVNLEGKNLEAYLRSHEGKDVKCSEDPGIYRITVSTRRPFIDAYTFYAHGGQFEGLFSKPSYEPISSSFLLSIPEGQPMKAEESPYWPKLQFEWDQIKQMKFEDAIMRIEELLK